MTIDRTSPTLPSTGSTTKDSSAVIRERLALLAGAAGAAVLGGEASAAIVAADGSFPLRGPATAGSTFWDVDGDGTNDFQLRNTNVSYITAFFSAINGGAMVQNTTQPTGQLKRLFTNQGTTVVGAGAPFAALTGLQAAITYSGGWQMGASWGTDTLVPTTGYFGFRFTSGSDTFYGWAEMSVDNNGQGNGFEITKSFYENVPGTSIAVGAEVVPEPASIALLALGAGGLAALRRRKAAAGS